MVDEAAYREKQAQAACPLPCVFRAALLARQADCGLVLRHSLAERELLGCSQAAAHLNCEMLERLFVERATFPLKLRPREPLTHGTVMRLHCGGLRGLQQVLEAPRSDVHELVGLAQAQFGSLVDLPWEQIVAQIKAWQPRRRTLAPSAPDT